MLRLKVERILVCLSLLLSFVRGLPIRAKRRIGQTSLRKNLENISQKFANSVLKWWKGRGNRVVSIEIIAGLVMFFLLFLVIASVILFAIIEDMAYLVILQRPSDVVLGATINFLKLLAILLAVGIMLLYFRRIKQCTFKSRAINRVSFLRWDSASRYFQWTILVTYQISVLIVFGCTILTSYLKTQVTNQELIALPMSICIATVLMIMVFAIFVYLISSLGMSNREKAAYCFDYLTKVDEIGVLSPNRRFSADVNYVCETGVRKLDRLMLFDQYIGDELNLGPALSNVFLGLFWGDNEEKQQAKDFLRRIRNRLLLYRPRLSYRLIVRDLIEFCINTPNLSRLRETLSLNISPAKRVTTLRRLSENSVIVTAAGVCIAVISFIVSRLFPS
jgi:hypothetical protein